MNELIFNLLFFSLYLISPVVLIVLNLIAIQYSAESIFKLSRLSNKDFSAWLFSYSIPMCICIFILKLLEEICPKFFVFFTAFGKIVFTDFLCYFLTFSALFITQFSFGKNFKILGKIQDDRRKYDFLLPMSLLIVIINTFDINKITAYSLVAVTTITFLFIRNRYVAVIE
jgi:hypothetical protein